MSPRIAINDIVETRFAELLLVLGIRAQRMALPRVQDKTSAVTVNLPVVRAGERFVLKLNLDPWHHVCPTVWPGLTVRAKSTADFLT